MSTELETRLNELNAATAERKSRAAERYATLVRQTLDGEPTDAAAAAQVLSDIGRTPEDLAGDVLILERRRGWAEVVETEKRDRHLLAELNDAIEIERKKQAEVNATFLKKIDELGLRRAAVEGQTHAAAVAVGKLRETASPYLKARIAELEKQMAERGPQTVRMQRRCESLKSAIKGQTDGLAVLMRRNRPAEATQVEMMQAAVKRFNAELAQLESGLATRDDNELTAELGRLRARLLEP